MPKVEWIRDLSFYLLASLIILIYGAIGTINIWMGIAFIAFYFIYLGVVLWQLKNSEEEPTQSEDEVVDEGKMKGLVKDFVRRKSSIRVSDIGSNDLDFAKGNQEGLLEAKLPNKDDNHL